MRLKRRDPNIYGLEGQAKKLKKFILRVSLAVSYNVNSVLTIVSNSAPFLYLLKRNKNICAQKDLHTIFPFTQRAP